MLALVAFYDASGDIRCYAAAVYHFDQIPDRWTLRGYRRWCRDGARVVQQDAGAKYDPVTQVDPVTGYPHYCADMGPCNFMRHFLMNCARLWSFVFAGFPNTHDVGFGDPGSNLL